MESPHFKFASSFWIKLLGEIPESDCYVVIAPDISVESIRHIGILILIREILLNDQITILVNIVSEGSTDFKVGNVFNTEFIARAIR